MTRGGSPTSISTRAHARVAAIDAEPGQQGRAHAGRHEPVDRLVVVGAKDDIRRAAQMGLRARHVAHAVVGDERQAGHVGQRGAAAVAPQGRVLLDEQQERVAQQLDRDERAVGQREEHEGEVELAALDEAQQLALVGALHERDVHVGQRLGEAPDRARQDLGADAVVGAHAQLARAARRPGGEVRPRGRELVDDPPAVAQHDVARGRQRDRARAARALHEPHPDDPLEQRDLLADRRLRVAEGPGRAAERALARDGVERREVTYLDAEPTIRISHRHQNYSELC